MTSLSVHYFEMCAVELNRDQVWLWLLDAGTSLYDISSYCVCCDTFFPTWGFLMVIKASFSLYIRPVRDAK